MKKNTMMRVASVLLVAVLLSTCAISGTFAKYVTSAESEDSARVAKWGVTVTASTGATFAKVYNDEAGNAVVSAQDKVVAPGTNSDEVEGTVTFNISGQPEVATKIEIDIVEANTKEIKLAAGTYADPTNEDADFTLASDYYPVKFTLTKQVANEQPTTIVDGGTLAAVASALEGQSANFYAPNTLLDVVYTLSWEWAYEDDSTANIDKADTYLGNENPAQTLSYELKITLTQVEEKPAQNP